MTSLYGFLVILYTHTLPGRATLPLSLPSSLLLFSVTRVLEGVLDYCGVLLSISVVTIYKKDDDCVRRRSGAQRKEQKHNKRKHFSPFNHPAALAPHLASCVVELQRDMNKVIKV